jgi:hypothetical protein
MFITNGKSLFGNIGLIISLLILIILVYMSYNKCYVSNVEQFDITTPNTLQPPKDLNIKIKGGTVLVNFTIDNSINNKLPDSFIIVLAQYDNNKNNTGNNKIFLSNEYVLNTNVKNTSSIGGPQTNLCVIANGKPICQYTYSNLDVRDISGNLFYYKLGVAALYNNLNSLYVTPYNVLNSDKLFTLDSSTEMQNKQFKDYLDYKNGIVNNPISSNPSDNLYSGTISTADGKYELIKSQLGNYPDNLIIESQSIDSGTLSDIVDKSMAQGILNLNVTANKIS